MRHFVGQSNNSPQKDILSLRGRPIGTFRKLLLMIFSRRFGIMASKAKNLEHLIQEGRLIPRKKKSFT
jgi:hypothetical protein